jgi:hypothetical protein
MVMLTGIDHGTSVRDLIPDRSIGTGTVHAERGSDAQEHQRRRPERPPGQRGLLSPAAR